MSTIKKQSNNSASQWAHPGVRRIRRIEWGPDALACACKIPERITACGVVSSIDPPDFISTGMSRANRYLLSTSNYLMPLSRFMLWMMIGRYSQDEKKLEYYCMILSQKVPGPEKKILEDPDLIKPANEATNFPQEAHLSTIVNHIDEIMTAITISQYSPGIQGLIEGST